MPPPEPVPLESVVYLLNGSPKLAAFTWGSFRSGATMEGSTVSFGSRLLYTATGGVNCRGAIFGSLPKLAGKGERSPPPPPPCPHGLWLFADILLHDAVPAL